MTFDAKFLLTEPLPPALTVDELAAVLARLSEIGLGAAGVRLPGGVPVKQVQLVADGEQAAYLQLIDGMPRDDEQGRLIAAAPRMLAAMRRMAHSSDSEMADGDLARELACECIFEVTGQHSK